MHVVATSHTWRRHSVTTEKHFRVLGRYFSIPIRHPHPLTIVRLLPRWVRRWAYIDIVNTATTGNYSNTIVPELGAMEALRRWE